MSFSDLQKKLSGNKVSTVKTICIIFFAVIVILHAWIADDAYHGFIMSKNFMNGNGLVYNIGERTNASTTPLWLLLTTFLSCLTRNIEYTALAICVIASVTAFGLLLRRVESKTLVVIATIVCLGSYGFMSYTTSCLENCLIFLIQIIFVDYILNHNDTYSFKQLLFVAFLCSLSLLARFDTCFLMFFPTAYIFLRKKGCGFFKMLLAGFLGLMPVFAWLGFSVIYYGYPFPNTFYVKIRNDLSMMDYLVKGFNYYKVNFLCDMVTVLIIVIALIILSWKGNALRRMIAIGIFFKLVYILRIGGDFMLGRHLSGLFIVSVYVILDYASNKKSFGQKELYKAGAAFILLSLLTIFLRPIFTFPYNYDVGDERAVYFANTSIYQLIKSDITKTNIPLDYWDLHIDSTERRIAMGYHGDICYFAPGILVFNYADRLYMTDQGALADPLLPYMGVDWERSKGYTSYVLKTKVGDWRIGHLQRKIPEGYRESLQQDKNLIKDPEIHELYDKILLVVRGKDLFSKERLEAIWELNTKYRNFRAG